MFNITKNEYGSWVCWIDCKSEVILRLENGTTLKQNSSDLGKRYLDRNGNFYTDSRACWFDSLEELADILSNVISLNKIHLSSMRIKIMKKQ